MAHLRFELDTDRARVEALYDAAFGPGRFAKTSERLRAGSRQVSAASYVAEADDGDIVGAARAWPLLIDDTPGAVFIGPVAVAEAARGSALGLQLTDCVADAAAELGWPWAVLIGDLKYFSRVGFSVADAGLVPIAPAAKGRLLVKSLGGEGVLRGRVAPSGPRDATPPSSARPRSPCPASPK